MTTEASRPQPSPASPRSDQPPARRRSPIERVIVWGLILVLVTAVGLEARARIGYDKTLDALEARNLDRLSTLEDAIHFAPSRQLKTIRLQPVLELKWFSLLRDYRIALIIDSVDSDDPRVMTFQTAGEENGILALEGRPEPENPPPGSEGGTMPSGPPMHDASGGGPAGGQNGPPGGDATAGDGGAGDDPGADAGDASSSDAPLLSQP